MEKKYIPITIEEDNIVFVVELGEYGGEKEKEIKKELIVDKRLLIEVFVKKKNLS